MNRKLAWILVFSLGLVAFAHGQTPDSFDDAAEKQVAESLQTYRQKTGLAPLEWNTNLRDTARLHALELAKHGEIAGAFPGEMDLQHRLALSNVGIAAAAEVMAISTSAEGAQKLLANDATGQSNALSPKFTDVGIAVLEHDGKYYTVIDLVEALSKITVDELEAIVIKAIQDYRVQRKIMPLHVSPTKRLRRVACEMAKTGNLATLQVDPTLLELGGHVKNGDTHIINFTVIQPNDLLLPITRMAAEPTITTFAVGACMGQTSYYVSSVFYYDIKAASGR